MSDQGFGGGPELGDPQQPRPRRAYQEPDDVDPEQPTQPLPPQCGYPPASSPTPDQPTEVPDGLYRPDGAPPQGAYPPGPSPQGAPPQGAYPPAPAPQAPGHTHPPQPGYATQPPGPPPAAPPEEQDPNRLPLILGIVVLLGVAALIAYLVLRDGGDQSAEPAPVPASTAATTTAPTEAPAEPTVSEEPTVAPAEPTTVEAAPTTEAPAVEETTPEVEPTEEATEEATEEQPAPSGDIQPLTAADLPSEAAGYTLGDDLTYRQGDNTVFVMDLGIPEMDAEWQEMTFPDAQPVADNASCMRDDEEAQGCFILSDRFGVVTASGDPGVDITEVVRALAAHLR